MLIYWVTSNLLEIIGIFMRMPTNNFKTLSGMLLVFDGTGISQLVRFFGPQENALIGDWFITRFGINDFWIFKVHFFGSFHEISDFENEKWFLGVFWHPYWVDLSQILTSWQNFMQIVRTFWKASKIWNGLLSKYTKYEEGCENLCVLLRKS